MKKIMVKYTVKRDRLDSFQNKLSDFVENVQKETPDILEYNVLQGPDQVSFVHYIAFARDEAVGEHCELPSTQSFTQVMNESVASTPVCVYLNSEGQRDMSITDAICMYGCSTYSSQDSPAAVPIKPTEEDLLSKGDVVVYKGGTFISARGHLYFYVENQDNYAGDTTQATLYHISSLGKDGWALGLPKEFLEKVGHIDDLIFNTPADAQELRAHIEKLKTDLGHD